MMRLSLAVGVVLVVGSTVLAFQPETVKPAPLTAGGQPTATQPAASKPKEKKKVYDENADAKQQIAAALANAKKENRRVLIQWGGNWCGWCIKLNDLMTTNATLSRELMYEYDVVHIDAGQPMGKNIDLAKGYGATLDKDGFPFLTILDADGKPLANQETGSLENKDDKGESVVGEGMGHDPKKVLAFLKANEAKPADAQKGLDAALAEAKSSGKLVFLHFGAPWCPWCHRLDDWMDKAEPAALLAKGFVNTKIDVDRMTGGKEILAKYRPKDGGIPWFAFIDGDGKVVADSDAAKGGNIGFPSAKEELAHFAAMLAKATKLSDEDRAKLIDTLKGDKPASASAGH
jgi:thiol-disulfide isomerase/thioredoxin